MVIDIFSKISIPVVAILHILIFQSEIFNPGGQTFYNEAVMSSLGIPQVST